MSLSYHRTEMPWEALLREAVRMGYLSHQSGTCGLHIHVSRETFGYSGEDVARLESEGYTLEEIEDWLYGACLP